MLLETRVFLRVPGKRNENRNIPSLESCLVIIEDVTLGDVMVAGHLVLRDNGYG